MIDLPDSRILIVDDEKANTELLERLLVRWGFRQVVSTNDSGTVVSLCAETAPDLVLLDLHMPQPDGFELMSLLRPWTFSRSPLPILALTGDTSAHTKRRALGSGARDFLTKPFDPEEVRLRVSNLLHMRRLQLDLAGHGEVLETKVRERTRELDQARLEILERLARAAEYRDDETGEHTWRVGRTSRTLAERLGLPEATSQLIGLAAPLHDVGKIAIPDTLLLKPGRLTPQERGIMKTHVTRGAEMLRDSSAPLLQMAEEIARYHHERWDGRGYAEGLSGEEIPLSARIVAVGDVFDALTHRRPYKDPMPVKEAVAEICEQRGSQFDPEVVDAFMECDHAELLSPVSVHHLRPQLPEGWTTEAVTVPVTANGHPSNGSARNGTAAGAAATEAPPNGAGADEPVTLSEAAEALAVSPSTVRRWANSGRLRAIRTAGGHRRFARSEIRKLSAEGPPRTVKTVRPPTHPTPEVGRAIADYGDEVASPVAAALYESRAGWFASDDCQAQLGDWLKAVSAACLGGDYALARAATDRFMRRADLAGTTLLERHAFLERFPEALVRRIGRTGRLKQPELTTLQVLFAHLRQSLLTEEDERETLPQRASTGT